MKKSHNILIIEDEIILRNAYDIILTSKGYSVTTAENGSIGLDLLNRKEPDLILLDLLMPILDGEDFLIKASMKTKHPNVKVIVYSNLSDQETVKKVLKLGVNKHVLKSSMSPDDLTNLVANLLGT